MYGKDLIPSAELSAKIVQILGGRPPEGFNYELFLDEEGKKISKSKGNGLSVEEWLRYAPPESLALYMYQQPRRAKRLYFDVIPRADRRLSRGRREAAGRGAGEGSWRIRPGTSMTASRPTITRRRRQLRHAAQPRERGAHRGQGRAVAVPAPLRAGRDAGERAVSRPAAEGRGRLLPGLREEHEEVPPAHRQGTRRRCRTSPTRCARFPRARAPSSSRTRSTRRASGTSPRKSCASGSRPSTRCCWAASRARAWAPSSSSTAATTS